MMNKISGGSARMSQIMTLFFFIPFLVLLTYTVLSKNFTNEGLMFLVPVLTISFVIIRRSFACADIYRDGSLLVIKKLFILKKIHVNDIKEVGETLWPFTYFLNYGFGNRRILFFSSSSDLFKALTLRKSNEVINDIESKIKRD